MVWNEHQKLAFNLNTSAVQLLSKLAVSMLGFCFGQLKEKPIVTCETYLFSCKILKNNNF